MARKVAIIGGGLAGTSCAYVLRQNGYEPVIFEAGDALASGASGNLVGLYNPRFFADKTPEADFYIEAFLAVCKLFAQFGSKIDHSAHGSLHLMTNEDKRARFQKMLQNWALPEEEMRILSPQEAGDIAGITLEYSGLFLPNSGMVNPQKLCEIYAEEVDVRLNNSVDSIVYKEGWTVNDENFNEIIFACGAGVKSFEQAQWLPVHTVRGQIAGFEQSEASQNLKTNLNYGGYITPAQNNVHTCGSTFQKWLDHTDILPEDNAYIKEKLNEVVPVLSGIGKAVYARASMRTASSDRLPMIGPVPNHETYNESISYLPNCYVSTAHGSHGIVSSYMAAQLILQHMQQSNLKHYASHFAPERFIKRLLKKNR